MRNTTLCYIERGEQYLMLHRVKKEHDLNHDKWVGIGGKFERDETPDECLLREAQEETGLTLTDWRCRRHGSVPVWPFLEEDNRCRRPFLYVYRRAVCTAQHEGYYSLPDLPVLPDPRCDRLCDCQSLHAEEGACRNQGGITAGQNRL